LEGQSGSIKEVVNVHMGKVHSERTADGIGLTTGDGSVHYHQITLGDWTSVARAGSNIMAGLNSIHADGAIASIVRSNLDDNANVVPAWEELVRSVGPLVAALSIVGMGRVGGTAVKDGLAGPSKFHSVIENLESVSAAVQIGNVQSSGAEKLEHDGSHASNRSERECHPSAVHWEVANGALNGVHGLDFFNNLLLKRESKGSSEQREASD
jgi:hypothetical protein